MKTNGPNGKYAVITGASCGIGEAFAREYARRGYHLLITGRRGNLLESLAEELRVTCGIKVQVVLVDFIYEKQLKTLLHAIEGLDRVEVLVNNAGFGCRKKFFEDSFANQEKMLKVHIHATCAITHCVVPKLMSNGCGTIVNVSSLAAFTPLADNYFYSASKAFLATFSESLHLGLYAHRIKVQALCPGFTITEFHRKLGKATEATGKKGLLPWMTAGTVVMKSLHALDHHKGVIYIPGMFNKLIFRLVRLLPRRLYYSMAQNLSAA